MVGHLTNNTEVFGFYIAFTFLTMVPDAGKIWFRDSVARSVAYTRVRIDPDFE